MTAKLPNGVDEIIDYIAGWAAGYSTGLKWNEVAKLKADMMNVPGRLQPVAAEALRVKCLAAGLNAADVETVVNLLRKRQAGHRLVPTASYRDFQFQYELDELPPLSPTRTSRKW